MSRAPPRGTTYETSDDNKCNFGSPDGRVFASNTGTCTITVKNGGRTVIVPGTVTNFTPAPVSFLDITGGGYLNGVAVSGDWGIYCGRLGRSEGGVAFGDAAHAGSLCVVDPRRPMPTG